MPNKLSSAELIEIANFNASIINQQYQTIADANKGSRGGMAWLLSHNICILRKGEKGERWFRLPKEFRYRIGMQYQEIYEWLQTHKKPCSADIFYNQFLCTKRFTVSENLVSK